MKKIISILVTVYNTKQFLPKLIESLKNQTYKDLELVFVNDGSVDGSEQLLYKEFSGFENVKIVNNEKNLGTFMSRYKGFKNCTGDYVICIDSDDYIKDDYIETMLNYLLKYNCDVVLTNQVGVKLENNQYIEMPNNFAYGEKFWEDDCFKTFFNCSQPFLPYLFMRKLVKKDIIDNVLNDIDLIDFNKKNITMGEDIVYSLLIYFYSKKVGQSNDSIYYYLTWDEQTVSAKSKEVLMKKITSLCNSLRLVKEFLINKNIYENFKDDFYKLVKKWEGYYFFKMCKFKCVDEGLKISKEFELY